MVVRCHLGTNCLRESLILQSEQDIFPGTRHCGRHRPVNQHVSDVPERLAQVWCHPLKTKNGLTRGLSTLSGVSLLSGGRFIAWFQRLDGGRMQISQMDMQVCQPKMQKFQLGVQVLQMSMQISQVLFSDTVVRVLPCMKHESFRGP